MITGRLFSVRPPRTASNTANQASQSARGVDNLPLAPHNPGIKHEMQQALSMQLPGIAEDAPGVAEEGDEANAVIFRVLVSIQGDPLRAQHGVINHMTAKVNVIVFLCLCVCVYLI